MPATNKDYVILNNGLQIFSPKPIKSRPEILRKLRRKATQNLITILLSISQKNASHSGQSSLFGKICGEPHVIYHEITVNSIVSFLLSNKTRQHATCSPSLLSPHWLSVRCFWLTRPAINIINNSALLNYEWSVYFSLNQANPCCKASILRYGKMIVGYWCQSRYPVLNCNNGYFCFHPSF